MILETYGWRYTFQLIGLLSLVWVVYFRNYVLLWSRVKLNMLNAKEAIIVNPEDPLQLNPTLLNVSSLSPLPNPNSSVPWREILTKPAFWFVLLVYAHIQFNSL